MKTFLIIIGTRPEAIKLFPVILALKKTALKIFICISNQHTESVLDILSIFDIKPDFSLGDYDSLFNMIERKTKHRDLSALTIRVFKALPDVFKKSAPDYVLVQGDTTTALMASLCAFYEGIKVIHIEAGLRTSNKYEPFPEEMNRRLISEIADYHFAPSSSAFEIIKSKGLSLLTGNTVIDAIRLIQDKILSTNPKDPFEQNKKIVLVTAHRRENWTKLEDICSAIVELADIKKEISYVFITHPNRKIWLQVYDSLRGSKVGMCDPLDYLHFIQALRRVEYLITDSGGLQEEAAFFGKFVFVMRNQTERVESLNAGLSVLVGTTKQEILNKVLNTNTSIKPSTIYGDGFAAEKIVSVLEKL